MQCPQCHNENPAAAKFCNSCGAKLNFACPQCAHENPAGSRFCNECGTALTGKSKVKRQKYKPTARPQHHSTARSGISTQPSEAERRQLTVMFCDLVGSTALSAQLDPEELREVIGTYQQTCAAVIQRYDGHIAQYLGDGLLVYFGYPTAHEDDAQRAVRAGLEIVTALGQRDVGTGQAGQRLQVRLGIHTGPVVVGEMGGGNKREQLALGETPNLAARLQGLAAPNTVVLSDTTQRLVAGFFDWQNLGLQPVKGLAAPVPLYQVLGARTVHPEEEEMVPTGLTPLVGREEELALLHRRWAQSTEQEGQVVLLSGEPGIGKSRLVRELRARTDQDGALRLEFRCSPYAQNSALAPVIEHLQRLLHWQKDDTPQTKLAKLHTTLARYRFPQADTPVLFATLLSLPPSPDAPPLNLSPQRQKQKTLDALIAWLVEEAEHAPVYCVWEDLHWADPSTLELLELLIEQTPTTRLFVLLTSRPEFIPPWGQHGHISQLTLSRLGRRQIPQMIAQARGGTTLPPDVVAQIVTKTDGIPLFVEELTKMVVETMGESGVTGGEAQPAVPVPTLGIPTTLQDALMARLDRLGAAKELAQLGATLGREFSYDVLRSVVPGDESILQHGLRQLVQAELLYQRGSPPQSTYLFKHALIQDTAYHSLLRSRRRQLHQQIAQVLETQFPHTAETQPELLAQHYTEAGLIAPALPYWQQAGQRAVERSAYLEAINHLTKGLEVLQTLPDTLERARHELALQLTLGAPLRAIKGYAAPEIGIAFTRARELCQQLGETTQLFPVLWGLWYFYVVRAEYYTARELGEQCLALAQRAQDPVLLIEAHFALGTALVTLGEITLSREHLEQGIALYNPQEHRALTFLLGQDLKASSCCVVAMTLWHLGYADQAVQRCHEGLALAQELSHPFSLVYAQRFVAWIHQYRREAHIVHEHVEAGIALATEHGFVREVAWATIMRGWAMAMQGQAEEGIAGMRQGLAIYRATGSELALTVFFALLADEYRKVGQPEEGLAVLVEAFAQADKSGERWYEAELYRLKGELLLAQAGKG